MWIHAFALLLSLHLNLRNVFTNAFMNDTNTVCWFISTINFAHLLPFVIHYEIMDFIFDFWSIGIRKAPVMYNITCFNRADWPTSLQSTDVICLAWSIVLSTHDIFLHLFFEDSLRLYTYHRVITQFDKKLLILGQRNAAN